MSEFSPTMIKSLAEAMGIFLVKKNAVYGDSFAKVWSFIQLLYPNGIAIEDYTNVLTLARVFDKMMRVATNKDALGESPWMDIAGYALLMMERETRDGDIKYQDLLNELADTTLPRDQANCYLQMSDQLQAGVNFAIVKSKESTIEQDIQEVS